MSFRCFKQWLKYASIPSFAVLVSILIAEFYSTTAQTTAKGGIDWILVVDTSASMRGVGGTKDIFAQVQNSITEFVNTARVGDKVTLYTFDQDVTLHIKDIAINSNPDRGKLKEIIKSLQAQGVRTHTGKAVQKALQHSGLLSQKADALGRTVSIVFLTDGVEDVRGIPNPVSIPSNTQLLRQQQCKPYIFFVSLGLKEHEKQLNDFANNPALCNKGRVLRDPGGVQLNQLAQNIRPVLVKPKLDVNSPKTELERFLPGTTTKPLNIDSLSNVNAKVGLRLEDPNQSGIRLIAPNKDVDLVANQPTVIPVQLQIPPEVRGGDPDLRLVMTAKNKAIAPITIDLPVIIQPKLAIQPGSIDFGSIDPGKTTETQTLVVSSNISGKANLQLQDNPPEISLAQPLAPISLQVGETKIPVQLQVTDNSSEGQHTFKLIIIPDDPIANPITSQGSLNILMPLGRKLLIWLVIALLLLFIVLIAICLIQRKTPWELIHDLQTRNHLEGELEILEPLPISPEGQYISLTHRQVNKIPLSMLIPEIDATKTDAELVTIWRAGKKNIDLYCVQGVILINSQKITTSELYDQDIIELAQVKLRFNWIGNQRP
ncbi:vWA domain-containing protein [Cronbergia sp. UHCC 0137]|uniref:vWA domain-containing protein n=1 Tax=Cronbergia sp. UHCC 0137 TaxID=3110239 RepID=UPI002B2123AF|nr:vWA domain-containing protein [Cronbergia sp. UHCC 0137]MEA5617729.1 vWA domain-containing protein [Cronbergia sp. UHCC 0137]